MNLKNEKLNTMITLRFSIASYFAFERDAIEILDDPD
jgi:hypothetical protein